MVVPGGYGSKPELPRWTCRHLATDRYGARLNHYGMLPVDTLHYTQLHYTRPSMTIESLQYPPPMTPCWPRTWGAAAVAASATPGFCSLRQGTCNTAKYLHLLRPSTVLTMPACIRLLFGCRIDVETCWQITLGHFQGTAQASQQPASRPTMPPCLHAYQSHSPPNISANRGRDLFLSLSLSDHLFSVHTLTAYHSSRLRFVMVTAKKERKSSPLPGNLKFDTLKKQTAAD